MPLFCRIIKCGNILATLLISMGLISYFLNPMLRTSVIHYEVDGGIDQSFETQNFRVRDSGFIPCGTWLAFHQQAQNVLFQTPFKITLRCWQIMVFLCFTSLQRIILPSFPECCLLHIQGTSATDSCHGERGAVTLGRSSSQPNSIASSGHTMLSRVVNSIVSFNVGQSQQMPSLGQGWKAGIKTWLPGNNLFHELLLHRSPVHSRFG